MKRLTPVMRISAGLVLVTCSLLLILDVLGLTPIPGDAELQGRIRFCETLAAQAAASAERNDLASIRAGLHVAVERNAEVLSAGLRAADGRLLVATREHRRLWNPDPGDRSLTTHVRVPLFKRGGRWGTLEMRFEDANAAGFLAALWRRPVVQLAALLGLTGFFAYAVYMRKTLQYLDPSAVIPTRVQAALDVMAEGVILVDAQARIVLANTAFAELAGRPRSSLLGGDPTKLPWKTPPGVDPSRGLPWHEVIRTAAPVEGTPLRLEFGEGGERAFIVKAAPVLDGRRRAKGAIATFDDVTALERKSAELEHALAQLEKTQDEIRLQNEELQVLAQVDPLTGIANRRSFIDRVEHLFQQARAEGHRLCCLMADIDHFKQINDSHGHLTGDEVIRRVVEVLKTEVRTSDLICRFGGEEFCIVLRDVSTEAATLIADRLRRRVAAPAFARAAVTVSFGISSTDFGAETWHELVKQADDALYASKGAGRNRVTRWDEL